MKKTILIILAGTLISLTSCKKEHTCECFVKSTATYTDPSTGETETETDQGTEQEKITGKKKAAKATCEEDNGTTTDDEITTTIDCKLI